MTGPRSIVLLFTILVLVMVTFVVAGVAVGRRRAGAPRGEKRASNCRVALTVDAPRFLGLFLERLCPASA